MEVLTFAGLPTVMFLDVPSPERLASFSQYRAIGIAGIARSQSPGWMAQELPRIFTALASLNAPVMHYKVCSTMDSAPGVGSIGAAMDIGIPILAQRAGAADWQPVVFAAPGIRRYQAFGNLFATLDGATYRLDRHPVMQRHPVTPMTEADVRLHLGRQTTRPMGLVDLVAMKAGGAEAQLAAVRARGEAVVALDVVDDETLAIAGALIWGNRGAGLFAVGSQGVEYALVAHWRQAGWLAAETPSPRAAAVPQVVAVSGSVSSVTAGQIDWALGQGFDLVSLDPARALDAGDWQAAQAEAVVAAKGVLASGRSVIVATARGPDDPLVNGLTRAIAAANADAATINQRIGEGLGAVLARLLRDTGLRRAAIMGGDTSGHAARALGLDALEAIAPLTPGCPLCKAHAGAGGMDGVEIALKGGQMGGVDFLGTVRAGGAIKQGRH